MVHVNPMNATLIAIAFAVLLAPALTPEETCPAVQMTPWEPYVSVHPECLGPAIGEAQDMV